MQRSGIMLEPRLRAHLASPGPAALILLCCVYFISYGRTTWCLDRTLTLACDRTCCFDPEADHMRIVYHLFWEGGVVVGGEGRDGGREGGWPQNHLTGPAPPRPARQPQIKHNEECTCTPRLDAPRRAVKQQCARKKRMYLPGRVRVVSTPADARPSPGRRGAGWVRRVGAWPREARFAFYLFCIYLAEWSAERRPSALQGDRVAHVSCHQEDDRPVSAFFAASILILGWRVPGIFLQTRD